MSPSPPPSIFRRPPFTGDFLHALCRSSFPSTFLVHSAIGAYSTALNRSMQQRRIPYTLVQVPRSDATIQVIYLTKQHLVRPKELLGKRNAHWKYWKDWLHLEIHFRLIGQQARSVWTSRAYGRLLATTQALLLLLESHAQKWSNSN